MPTAPRFATIDVGTNSVLLLVAERQDDGSFIPIAERAEITRLGRGVDATRRLLPAAIELTARAVQRFAEEARARGAQAIACVATSAARDAENGAAFFDAVREMARVDPEVVSGDEEARLSHLAAERDFGPSPKVVVDIGGGSTEFIYGEHGHVSYRRSFDVGSVRLTERHVHTDPPTPAERSAVASELDRAITSLPPPPPGAEVVGIAGTVTTLLAIARGIHPYDGARVHGQLLRRSEVDALCDRLWRLPLRERQELRGLEPKRADVIPAGALILSRALARIGADAVRVSDRGVRWGLLYARFSAPSA